MEQVMGLIGSIDKDIWLIIGAIIAVLAIISLIKKAIKLGMLILVVAFVVTFGGSFVSNIKDKLGVTVVDSTLHIDNDLVGTYSIDLNTVESIVIKDADNSGDVIVDISMKSKTQTIEMPERVLWVVKAVLDKTKIDTVDLRK